MKITVQSFVKKIVVTLSRDSVKDSHNLKSIHFRINSFQTSEDHQMIIKADELFSPGTTWHAIN